MIDQNSIPQPSFRLWQPVFTTSTDEQGVTQRERGIVTGILYQSSYVPNATWTYQVHWYEVPGTDWLKMPYVDIVPDSDLEPDKLPLPQTPPGGCDYLRQVWTDLSRAKRSEER